MLKQAKTCYLFGMFVISLVTIANAAQDKENCSLTPGKFACNNLLKIY